MSRNAKIGIAVIVGIILVGICGCIGAFWYLGSRVVQSVVSDPEDIAKLRQEIADYDIPEGYDENGLNLFNLKALMLTNYSQSPESFILMAFPTDMELSQDEIDQAMQQVSQQSANTVWEQLDSITVTIQDQAVEMLVMEGVVGEYRQRRMQGMWRGQTGMILVQISGSVSGWDQDVVDTFLASIR